MSEAEWLTSRRVGFLAGAIDRIVTHDKLNEEGFSTVQLGVWKDLTGAAPDLFATRLYLLSSDGDIDVREGYDAGACFVDALSSGQEEAARAAWDADMVEASFPGTHGFGG